LTRVYPTGHADEKSMFRNFLNFYRETMIMKIAGLDNVQARWKPAETANSLLTLIVHLTGVETNWFQGVIAGREITRDRDAEFEEWAKGVETVDEAVAAYRAEYARSNEVLDAVASLDAPCPGEKGYSVRWVLAHMLEETARHAGHADITRELIDGTVGS
jgi:uncharacterized damage-inducible protein DinB